MRPRRDGDQTSTEAACERWAGRGFCSTFCFRMARAAGKEGRRGFFTLLRSPSLGPLGQLPKALASDWAQCTHRLHSVVGGMHGNTKAGVSFAVWGLERPVGQTEPACLLGQGRGGAGGRDSPRGLGDVSHWGDRPCESTASVIGAPDTHTHTRSDR